MTSAKFLGCCFTIILATVRHWDFDGFNSFSLISSTTIRAISLRSLADGSCDTSRHSVPRNTEVIRPVIMEPLLLDRLGVLEVDSEDGGSSVVVLKNMSEGSTGVSVKHVWSTRKKKHYVIATLNIYKQWNPKLLVKLFVVHSLAYLNVTNYRTCIVNHSTQLLILWNDMKWKCFINII